MSKVDKESRDRVVVYDLAKDNKTFFGKKMAARSPCLTELVENGRLRSGHILRDDRRPKVLAGDDVKIEDKSDYIVITD